MPLYKQDNYFYNGGSEGIWTLDLYSDSVAS